MIGDIIDEITRSEEHADTLSASEKVYLRFRRTVEPGLFDAGYDLLPSKSRARTSRITGIPFTDQPLRAHLLTGPAFAARANAALRKLDPANALSDEQLFNAMCLAAVHDTHKDVPGQQRWRTRERGVEAEDKDIPEDELAAVVDRLGLPKGGDYPTLNDYHASALAAEVETGRHRSAISRDFFGEMRHWVRLMDTAAAIESPQQCSQLSHRLANISQSVELRYHALEDTKGITTNLLNRYIADKLEEHAIELVAFFTQGAVYVAAEDAPAGIETFYSISAEQSVEEELSQLAPEFIETIVSANPDLGSEASIINGLDAGQWYRGRLAIPPMQYLFADVSAIYSAVRTNLMNRLRNSDDVSQYSVYQRAVKFAVATGLIDAPPEGHIKAQTLGVFLGTIYQNLLYDENTGLVPEQTREARRDLADAMGTPDAKQVLLDELSGDAITEDSLDEESLVTLAEYFEATPEEMRSELHDGVVTNQLRVESVIVALCYLNQDNRASEPLASILATAHDEFFEYYAAWQPDWDAARRDPWDDDWSAKRKRSQFETELLGNLPAAMAYYLRRYLIIDGEQYPPVEFGQKYEEYIRGSQARLCLLCNDQLVGKGKGLSHFETSESHVGRSLTFTHHNPVDPERKETTSVICPICDLELLLRNAVHSPQTGGDSLYLFLAPDYFHTPADIAIAEAVHAHLHTNAQRLVDQAEALIVGRPEERSDALDVVLDILEDDVDNFQQNVLNYDSGYTTGNTLGVFRVDPPRRPKGKGSVSRLPRWILGVYTATLFAWLTGSRVLLSDSPFPSTDVTEFDGMVYCEDVPEPVKRVLETDLSISALSDLGGPVCHTFRRWFEPYESGAGDVVHRYRDPVDDAASEPADTTHNEPDSKTPPHIAPQTLRLSTQLGVALYHQSALLYVTRRRYGYDLQRLKTVLEALAQPFPGAQLTLTGNQEDRTTDRPGQFAARVLDTLTHPNMRNIFKELADHGFNIVNPGKDASNYEYGRLYWSARDGLSDTVCQNSTRAELIEIVAGEVMGDGRRTRQNRGQTEYADEKYLREPAREFARVFVDGVFYDLCDGDFYELRRLENNFAAGYNAAMREREQEFFEQLNDSGKDEPEEDSSEDQSADNRTEEH